MTNLPTELITLILKRLPVKSLTRFKCVSKHWNSLISNPHLISLHLTQSLCSNTRLLILNYGTHLHTTPLAFQEEEEGGGSHGGTRFDLEGRFPGYEVSVCGSCNGLVALVLKKEGDDDDSVLEVVLWNPSIGCWFVVPRPPKDDDLMKTEFMGVSFGFGFDEVKDDYKIVRVVDYFFVSDAHHDDAGSGDDGGGGGGGSDDGNDVESDDDEEEDDGVSGRGEGSDGGDIDHNDGRNEGVNSDDVDGNHATNADVDGNDANNDDGVNDDDDDGNDDDGSDEENDDDDDDDDDEDGEVDEDDGNEGSEGGSGDDSEEGNHTCKYGFIFREVMVYSLKNNCWNKIHVTFFGDKMEWFCPGAVINNHIVHWLFWAYRQNKPILRGFDLLCSKWTTLSLPDFRGTSTNHKGNFPSDDEDFDYGYNPDDYVVLGVLDECLCLVTRICPEFDNVYVWVMKEYGVKESWTKLFDVAEASIVGPLLSAPIACCNGGDDVLLRRENEDGRLSCYDLKGKAFKDAPKVPSCCGRKLRDVRLCVESLVPVRNMIDGSNRRLDEVNG